MAKQTRINFNLDGLTHLQNQLGRGYYARVGVLGSKAVRGADSSVDGNADIGLIHEYGSQTANIPERSFLRVPLALKRDEIKKVFDTAVVKEAMEAGDIRRVFGLLGVRAEQIVQEAFSTGGFGHWTPLKEDTVKRKGSSAILMDTGQLRRAITSDVKGKGE